MKLTMKRDSAATKGYAKMQKWGYNAMLSTSGRSMVHGAKDAGKKMIK